METIKATFHVLLRPTTSSSSSCPSSSIPFSYFFCSYTLLILLFPHRCTNILHSQIGSAIQQTMQWTLQCNTVNTTVQYIEHCSAIHRALPSNNWAIVNFVHFVQSATARAQYCDCFVVAFLDHILFSSCLGSLCFPPSPNMSTVGWLKKNSHIKIDGMLTASKHWHLF